MHIATRCLMLALPLVMILGCAEQNKQIVALEEENAQLRSNMAAMETRLAVATDRSEQADTRIAALQDTLDEHLARMEEFRKREQATQISLAALQQRLSASEAQAQRLVELEQAAQATQHVIQMLEAEIAQLIAESQEMEAESEDLEE